MHRRPMFFGTLRWKPQQEMAATFLATFLDLRGRNCGLFIHLVQLCEEGKPEKKSRQHFSGTFLVGRGGPEEPENTCKKQVRNLRGVLGNYVEEPKNTCKKQVQNLRGCQGIM